MPEDIFILHMHTKNYNHMMYEIWCATDGQMGGKATCRGGCPT